MTDPIKLETMSQDLRVRMEVRAPGLDRYSHRMTYRRMLMGEIHDNLQWLSVQARAAYREQ